MPPRPEFDFDRDRGSARLSDAEIDALEDLLDSVPSPFEPLDAAMLDGFLAGVALQPEPIDPAAWLPYVFDAQGRAGAQPAAPGGAARVEAMARRRLSFLAASIAAREPFDPIVYGAADPARGTGDGAAPSPSSALAPWAAGFVNAMVAFPGLTGLRVAGLAERLAAIVRHLPAEDREVLAELKDLAEALAPLDSVDDAIDEVVGSVLELADLVHPRRPVLRGAPKVGRNDPCPCGSGRKFKQCHGA